jgi:hypothetical protein
MTLTLGEKSTTFSISEITYVKKGVTYSAIKIFNHLPSYILELEENKTLSKLALRKNLLTHVFYSVEEFLAHNNDTN